MESWIYLYSKFTSEALLFEALFILFLCCSYAAFWILRKRRFGVIEQSVPAGVVRTYLSELILDAEQLRAQLFGILKSAGLDIDPNSQVSLKTAVAAAPGIAAAIAADPNLTEKLSQLETKMAEKDKAMQALIQEKERIEKDLSGAKTASKEIGSSGGDNAELASLKEKIQILEGKLEEYSVIEDDLANLKRLQQENTQLKAALQNQGAALPSAAAAASSPALAPAPSPATPPQESSFDSLVNQVEETLQPPPPETVSSNTPDSTSGALPANGEKSDGDLVAEFEKMLNG